MFPAYPAQPPRSRWRWRLIGPFLAACFVCTLVYAERVLVAGGPVPVTSEEFKGLRFLQPFLVSPGFEIAKWTQHEDALSSKDKGSSASQTGGRGQRTEVSGVPTQLEATSSRPEMPSEQVDEDGSAEIPASLWRQAPRASDSDAATTAAATTAAAPQAPREEAAASSSEAPEAKTQLEDPKLDVAEGAEVVSSPPAEASTAAPALDANGTVASELTTEEPSGILPATSLGEAMPASSAEAGLPVQSVAAAEAAGASEASESVEPLKGVKITVKADNSITIQLPSENKKEAAESETVVPATVEETTPAASAISVTQNNSTGESLTSEELLSTTTWEAAASGNLTDSASGKAKASKAEKNYANLALRAR
mmetsp:Transcript_58325/g.126074  ORF Transcript_58325/g.126074 Transcript_58325/m.126074 type:complete len:368 (+) Transcript_58325:134-1237(+)